MAALHLIDSAPHPLLRVTLLRRFSITVGKSEIRLRAAPVRALLAYLALTDDGQETRERLAAILWEDGTVARARRNLRQTLYDLRAQLPPALQPCIVADRARIAFDTGTVHTDAAALLAELGRGRVPETLLTVPSIDATMLGDLEVPSEAYESWLRLRQREFADALHDGLTAIMEGVPGEEGRRAAEALLKLDPSDEGAVRHLIRSAATRGETARAFRLYNALWDLLETEFDSEPSDETQALVVAVKQGRIDPVETATRAASRDRRAEPAPPTLRPELRIEPLRALPRTDPSPVPTLFRSELVACLARFRAWHVLDGDFTDREGNFAVRLLAAGEAEAPTLSASVIDCRSGTVLWSRTVDDLAREWLDLREALAGNIAAACDLSLTRARLSELAARATPQDAIDHWLMGQKLLDAFRPEDWVAAERHFQAAHASDPGFARALASLAQARNIRHLAFPGIYPDTARFEEALDFANRAVAADPFDAQAHLCRAWAAMLLRMFSQAEVSFALALRCNSDDPWTVISSALGYAFMGERDTATDLANRFDEGGWTTSHWPWGYRANICFLADDLPGCLAAFENAGSGLLNMPGWAASAAALLGDEDMAARHWQTFEAGARRHWTGDRDPDSEALLDWFGALFPLRHDADRAKLLNGARKAMTAYRHWVTE